MINSLADPQSDLIKVNTRWRTTKINPISAVMKEIFIFNRVRIFLLFYFDRTFRVRHTRRSANATRFKISDSLFFHLTKLESWTFMKAFLPLLTRPSVNFPVPTHTNSNHSLNCFISLTLVTSITSAVTLTLICCTNVFPFRRFTCGVEKQISETNWRITNLTL